MATSARTPTLAVSCDRWSARVGQSFANAGARSGLNATSGASTRAVACFVVRSYRTAVLTATANGGGPPASPATAGAIVAVASIRSTVIGSLSRFNFRPDTTTGGAASGRWSVKNTVAFRATTVGTGSSPDPPGRATPATFQVPSARRSSRTVGPSNSNLRIAIRPRWSCSLSW